MNIQTDEPPRPVVFFNLDELAEVIFPHIIDLCQTDLAAGRHPAENRIGIAVMHEAIRILDLSRCPAALSQVIKEPCDPDETPIEQKFAEDFPRLDALIKEAAGRVPKQGRRTKSNGNNNERAQRRIH